MSEDPTVAAPGRLNFVYHAIIGVAIGLITPFTGFAWIPAILTGIVIGRSGVERTQGIKVSGATQALRVLAVTGGVLAMLVFGAILGGLVAFLIVALAAFSERVAGGTSPIDQGIAEILVTVIAVIMWFVVVFVLNLNLSIRFGS